MTASALLEMTTEANPQPDASRPPAFTVPAHLDRIVLTGFMGSGKTTVGRMLAETTGWSFHDLDDEIARRTGKTVPQIFAEDGEAQFRKEESAALVRLLGQRRMVLALGGGAPEPQGNQLLLEQTPRTAVVYLSAPLQTLLDRCGRQAEEATATKRPLLNEAETRFRTRHPIYERIAGHRITTTHMDAEQVAAAILKELAS